MTVRISREIAVPAPPERVWEFIADPDNRAAAISVVEDWETTEDGTTVWHVRLPIPVINRTIRVETNDRERNPPKKVSFAGRSKVFRVQGEHELVAVDGGTRLTNRFMVDGRVPGVESFFKRGLDDEIDNLEDAMLEWLEETEEATAGEGAADATNGGRVDAGSAEES